MAPSPCTPSSSEDPDSVSFHQLFPGPSPRGPRLPSAPLPGAGPATVPRSRPPLPRRVLGPHPSLAPSLTVDLVLVLFSPHGSVSRVIGAWETWQLTCHQPRPPALTSQPHPCLWSPTHSSSSFLTPCWRAGSWKASPVRGSGQGCLLGPHGPWPEGLPRSKKTLQNFANYFNHSTVTPTPSCQRLSVEMRFALD